jgi:parallel beta-helix repeat protein
VRENSDVWVLAVEHADHTLIENNSAERSGIWFLNGANDSVMRDNFVHGNRYTAIATWQTSNNVIEGNHIVDAGEVGIVLEPGSEDTLVSGNEVDRTFNNRESVRYGAFDGSGILVQGSTQDNRIEGNAVFGSELDGIVVAPGAAGTLLLRNRADRNGDDGIHVEDPSTTLTGNVANLNSDLGIEAVEGVVDGGDNQAVGNGNSAQCLNISCGPQRDDYKNAASFCEAERAYLGDPAFRQKYRTEKDGKNAYGKCVSRK